MAAPAIMVGAAVLGTGVSIYGQRKAAKARQAALNAAAGAKRQAALAMLDRFELNKKMIQEEGRVIQGKQVGAFAKAGVDVGEGTPLAVLEQTNKTIVKTIDLEEMEVDAQVAAMLAGASADETAGYQAKEASKYQMLGTFFSGAGTAAEAAK